MSNNIFLLPLLMPAIWRVAVGQQIGYEVPEEHPPLTWSRCDDRGCSDITGSLVLDAEFRWLHFNDSYESCFESGTAGLGGSWHMDCVVNQQDCTERCALEGGEAKYESQLLQGGPSGRDIGLKWHARDDSGQQRNIKLFLLEDEDQYQMFTLMNNELSFEVDVSRVPCGLNAAVTFTAMDADGGIERFPTQQAGARYGTGSCDAQCSRSLRWAGGEANSEGWESSQTIPTGGLGLTGACCSEMSVWNSNFVSYTMESRPCQKTEYTVCDQDECSYPYPYNMDPRYTLCAPKGCDNNPYRLGNDEFYGGGKAVNTMKPFTVVTRFEETGVKQFFIQEGQRIEPPAPVVGDVPDVGGLSEAYCEVIPSVYDERDLFSEVGGWYNHNEALQKPMVMSLSIYDDYYAYNLWLSGAHYPLDRDPSQPGVVRGSCTVEESDPWHIRYWYPDSNVRFSNIRFGPVGTTVDAD